MQVSNEKPIFIVDAMLGKLAKKLRLLGYDSFYSSNMEDDKIIQLAKKENRILITKDVPLTQKAKKQQILTVQITSDDEIEQFLQINEKTSFGKCTVGGDNSRCPVCNGELQHIEKKDVSDKVPKGVLEKIDNFWNCTNCYKIYWEGTHIERLQKFVDELNEKL
ncbi:hypothetical protein LCGC14_1383530 [marine sediment metagenome]|uniref:Mut7-C RNAse domain-containing protein n=1 Tax=marine sediment metagenome TaxID=412755 RepID=A0A0F9N3K1_9ZZZZ